MLRSHTINNTINHLHERCLHIVCSDRVSSFEKNFRNIDRSVPILIRNQQILATEVFKVNRDFSSTFFSELFSKRNIQYNFSHNFKFSVPKVRSTFHVTESFSYLEGPKFRDIEPEECENLSSINVFKREIEKWKPKSFPCILCKGFIPNIGFI